MMKSIFYKYLGQKLFYFDFALLFSLFYQFSLYVQE